MPEALYTANAFAGPGFIPWLQKHLLPCPFKYFTGYDCPGCGFQRAVLLLLKGDVKQSFLLYPPTIPILLFLVFMLFDYKLAVDKKHFIKKAFFMVTGYMVLISYVVKITHL